LESIEFKLTTTKAMPSVTGLEGRDPVIGQQSLALALYHQLPEILARSLRGRAIVDTPTAGRFAMESRQGSADRLNRHFIRHDTPVNSESRLLFVYT
jgi:hypothetical protein